MAEYGDDRSPTFAGRVRKLRERRGMTRPVLGGLVGRSAEWVKAIESGRIGMPRLPILLRLADVLAVRDLSELTGNERLAASAYSKSAHEALPLVTDALTAYRLTGRDEPPTPLPELLARVAEAWRLWHGAGEHRTRVARVLPGLIGDMQHAVHTLEGAERRRARAALVEVYHLTQLYLSFQPVPELVMLAGDRAMNSAQDADSPRAVAAAAWYLNHVFRDAGERHEARVELALRAAGLLDPGQDADALARWGLLQLAVALSYAKTGRRGEAERYWDLADDAATRLGPAYAHPSLIFGRAMVDAYAITLQADLVRGRAAVQVSETIDLGTMPSATRQGFHLLESARAYSMEREPLAVLHLLTRAHRISPETARFNFFARAAVADLAVHGPTTVRGEAEVLRQQMDVPAAA